MGEERGQAGLGWAGVGEVVVVLLRRWTHFIERRSKGGVRRDARGGARAVSRGGETWVRSFWKAGRNEGSVR